MLERLKAKPSGETVTTICGDFGSGDARSGGPFDLVLLLVNTLYAMPTQDHQVACFANAAAHLAPGGRFVVEAWVPDPPRGGDGLELRARRLGSGFAGLVIEEHDAARQVLSTRQIVISESGQTRSFPIVHRYAWPAEMDLMARLAGMTLEERWADWHKRPFSTRGALTTFRCGSAPCQTRPTDTHGDEVPDLHDAGVRRGCPTIEPGVGGRVYTRALEKAAVGP